MGVINGIIQIINGLITALCKFKIPIGICSSSYKGIRMKLRYEVEKRNSSGNWTSDGNINSEWTGLLDIDAITGGDVDPSYGIDATCGDIEEVLKDYRNEVWEFLYPGDPNIINYGTTANPQLVDGRLPKFGSSVAIYSSALCPGGNLNAAVNKTAGRWNIHILENGK